MTQNNDSPGKRLKREEAKLIKPTTQDSLDLYNQAKVIDRFYGSNPLYKKIGEKPFGTYLKDNKTSYKELLSKPDDNFNNLIDPDNIKYLNYRFGTNLTEQELKNKFKNKGVFKTYPNIVSGFYDTWINPKVPPIYLHPLIKPHSVSSYKADYKEFSDLADVPRYDPLAIKPVSMLTPKERVEREKKYGAISPVKRPVIERKASETIEPIAPRQAPSPILTREEIIAPVPRPVDVPPAPAMKEPVIEEQVVTERPVARKPPKAVMPRRAGGWSNQPLLMQLFPRLYQK